MILRYPWLLLLLLLVPALTYLRYARGRRPALRFSDGEALRRLPRSWAVRASRLLPALYALGLALLVLALARPQHGLAESRTRTEGVDIVLLVDLSTSMRAEDFSTPTERINRLDAAKRVIREFVQHRPDDRIGLIAFSAMPYTVAPLTLDQGWLLLQLDRLETGMLEDGTAIGSAIASAVNRLRESKAKSRIIVLLTDGINNAGKVSPDIAAQAAQALGVKIYTVGAGKSGIVPMPVKDPFGNTFYVQQASEIDEPALQRIATSTGGLYFRATDLDGLRKVYRQIDKLEKTEIQVERFSRFEERFAPFLLWALGLLGLEQLLALTRLGRIP